MDPATYVLLSLSLEFVKALIWAGAFGAVYWLVK